MATRHPLVLNGGQIEQLQDGDSVPAADKLAAARTISLSGDAAGSASFDGSGNVSIATTVADDSHNHVIGNVDGLQSALDGKAASSHTHSYAPVSHTHGGGDITSAVANATSAASCSGNAATATKLATARTISLTGDVTGSASFDGSGNAAITATVADDSHNHTIANVDSLQTTLDGKVPTERTVTAGNGMTGGGALSGNITLTMGTPGDITSTSTNGVTATSHTHAVTSIDATKITGTIADARLSGTYSGFTHKIDGSNAVYTTSSSGSSSTLARTVYGLAEYRSASSAQVGAIVFIAPNTTSTIMYQFEIAGMLYNQHIVSTQVQGYRTTGAWSALKKCSAGTVDVMVRFGVTPDGKNCLILGDVATSWSYPHLSIIRAMFSHTNAGDAHCTGWTTAVVTDLSTYTNVTSAIADSAMVGSITGNAATATKLATARTISLTGDVTGSASFDGSANASITATVADDSHTHIGGNITSAVANATTAASCSGNAATATKLATTRALTIGSTAKNFDGSAAVTWSLAEIGAAASSHTHSYAQIPTSSTLPVGTFAFMGYYGSSDVLNDGTTSGANLRPVGVYLSNTDGSLAMKIDATQAGTWKNISGATVIRKPTNGLNSGLFVRTA